MKRRIPIIAAVTLALALSASLANAAVERYRILYPPTGPQESPQDAMLGPGGAKRVVVNFSLAAPGLRSRPNEITAISSVVVTRSSPESPCGFPTVIIDSGTQFTLDWGAECPVGAHVVFVTVTSSGPQSPPTGSWKDAGGAERRPADIINIGRPVPGLSPLAGGALVLLAGSAGLFAIRRRSLARG
jgi:hypothetical protein